MIKKILYLGWLGKGNVGDDLLFEIFKHMLYTQAETKKLNVIIDGYLPISSYEVSLSQYDLVVLGGGSLLGLEFWEDICLRADKLNIPIVIWGTGIDTRNANEREQILIAFQERNNYDINLYKTKKVVGRAKYASVRGKITDFLINDKKTEVIGDPCIVFNKIGLKYSTIDYIDKIEKSNEELILINWGTSYNNIFGGNEKVVEEQLEIATQILLNKGYKIVVYPIWTEDIEFCKKFVDRFKNTNIISINKVYDVYGLASLIRKSKFSINLKLHANILSMALKKPFISLAYGLKCYDFADSIESSQLVIPTDKVNVGKILSKVEYINQNYNNIQMLFDMMIDEYYEKHVIFMEKIISLINQD